MLSFSRTRPTIYITMEAITARGRVWNITLIKHCWLELCLGFVDHWGHERKEKNTIKTTFTKASLCASFHISLTFHYLLYPVWLCMWQIIKNLASLKLALEDNIGKSDSFCLFKEPVKTWFTTSSESLFKSVQQHFKFHLMLFCSVWNVYRCLSQIDFFFITFADVWDYWIV